jgi:flagellar hook assembly protein FlgD
LRIPFGKEKLDYSHLKIFPSPFRIPYHTSLKVDGLPYNSSMSIMMLDGKNVRNIKTQGISVDGDQLIWDGRDESGDLVSSGVYLIAIYGLDGFSHMEKITVIKD